MTIENDAARLLLWLNKQTRGDTYLIVDVDVEDEPEVQDISEERAITLIEHLRNRGWVITHNTFASGTTCRITSSGVAAAERFAQERDDPRRKFDFAADSLIAAAMKFYPAARIELMTFVGTKHMWFYDYVLELDEVQRAADYLEEKRLATVERRDSQAQAIILTALGIECGSVNTISVRTFLNEQQRDSRPHITVHGPAQIGDYNTQHNTFGYDPNQLAQFARELLAAASSADITETARARVVADAEALQGELAVAEPNPGRVRQFLERAKESAWENLPGAVTQAILMGIGLG
ncbi:hypothetical protein ACFYXH_40570 [Streptomyces sp. NPDC002730]|uniref:hypothetical protein n=1 Tax=Streptomyces sp. NPDC002730 TaxID=3364662 RepID=UPI0036CD6045